MDVFNQIGNALAQAELNIAQSIGQVVGLQHRGGVPTAFYATILSMQVGHLQEPRGRLVETLDLTLDIPVQPYAFSGVSGFSGISSIASQTAGITKPITVGDRIEWAIGTGRYFFVDQQAEVIHNGYAYLVHAHCERTLTGGEKS